MTTRDALLALVTVALMAASWAASLAPADAGVIAARVGFTGDPRDSVGAASGVAPTVALPAPKTLKNKQTVSPKPSGCGSVPCLQG